jgi:hypothetical protein
MDSELFLALMVLWSATTASLVRFFWYWHYNQGCAFHPHAVDLDDRHSGFLVVSSAGTECKLDCCVVSISSYVAPRGSSSAKAFQLLTVIISIAGMLGCRRWRAVGDASPLEAVLSIIGFAALLLVAGYEVDTSRRSFLEEKMRISIWFMERIVAATNMQLPPHIILNSKNSAGQLVVRMLYFLCLSVRISH